MKQAILEKELEIWWLVLTEDRISTNKGESEPALAQAQKYLLSNLSINYWVVNRTESDGLFELNSKLSFNSIIAIRKYLHERYKIKIEGLLLKRSTL